MLHRSPFGAWVLTRHADVHAASVDPATFCSGRGILVQEIGTVYDAAGDSANANRHYQRGQDFLRVGSLGQEGSN